MTNSPDSKKVTTKTLQALAIDQLRERARSDDPKVAAKVTKELRERGIPLDPEGDK